MQIGACPKKRRIQSPGEQKKGYMVFFVGEGQSGLWLATVRYKGTAPTSAKRGPVPTSRPRDRLTPFPRSAGVGTVPRSRSPGRGGRALPVGGVRRNEYTRGQAARTADKIQARTQEDEHRRTHPCNLLVGGGSLGRALRACCCCCTSSNAICRQAQGNTGTKYKVKGDDDGGPPANANQQYKTMPTLTAGGQATATRHTAGRQPAAGPGGSHGVDA